LPNHTLSLLSKNGSLKIVHEDTTTTTTTTQPISNITLDKPIKTVISSSLTTALIDLSGSVFTFGENVESQLGLGGLLGPVGSYHGGSQRARVDYPERVFIEESITSVALSRRHSLFLTSTGKVYSCGSSFDGALGLTDEILGSTRFIPVSTSPALVTGLSSLNDEKEEKKEDPIVCIGAGLSFSLALSKRGKLYFFGRLGHGGTSSIAASVSTTTRPKSVLSRSSSSKSKTITQKSLVHTEQSLFSPTPIIVASLDLGSHDDNDSETHVVKKSQICCGLHHALITVNDRLFSFGLSKAGNGALGSGLLLDSRLSEPFEIDVTSLLPKWGLNSQNEGGNKENMTSSTRPEITSISCGPFSSSFCVNGHVFICGTLNSPSLLGNVGSAAVKVIKSSSSDLALLRDVEAIFDDEEISTIVAQGKTRFTLSLISKIAAEMNKSSVLSGVTIPRFVPVLDTRIPNNKANNVSIDETRVLITLK
jgi:alpha-tubulin suppressor-like RCC1 family protein